MVKSRSYEAMRYVLCSSAPQQRQHLRFKLAELFPGKLEDLSIPSISVLSTVNEVLLEKLVSSSFLSTALHHTRIVNMTATRSPIRVADFANGLETYSLGSASPCQFRFLDCQRLIKENVTYVVAFLELLTQPYAVVSHPWRPATPATNIGASFEVKAIEKEPRISVDVLKTISIAASPPGSKNYVQVKTRGHREMASWTMSGKCKTCTASTAAAPHG